MSKIRHKLTDDSFLLKGSVALFALNMGIAYALYPHWVTFSHLALQAYTLPFFLFAMAVAIFLLWHTGKRLRTHELHAAGIAMYISAICAAFVVFIPYTGSAAQITAHNVAALFFVLFAAGGLAWLARKLSDRVLGAAAALQIGVCLLELVFLARFNQHPVDPWVWVVLQLFVTAVLLLSLLRVFSRLAELKA